MAFSEDRFVASLASRLAERLAPNLLRQIGYPSLRDLHLASANSLTASLLEFSGALIPGTPDPELLAAIRDEFRMVAEDIAQRYQAPLRNRLSFPVDNAVEVDTAEVLYLLVRLMRPQCILETGVGNGHSTAILLSALRRNGSGTLHSTDVDPTCGGLISEPERRAWRLHLLRPHAVRGDLVRLLAALPEVDIYLHDSGHSYGWQLQEYAAVLPRISRDGIFLSDDVDSSFAFIDFCRQTGVGPAFLWQRRKVIGGFRMDLVARPSPAS